MDDDLPHPPEELPKLIKAIHEHPNMLCVMGLFEAEHPSRIRNSGSKLYQLVLKLLYGKDGATRRPAFESCDANSQERSRATAPRDRYSER